MDLLRTLAILLVILAHTVLSYGAPEHLAPLQFGGTGVDLFFVLSGWLLGGLLFKELKRNGKVDIKKFWTRRWMRTLPAYFVVLLLSVAQRYMTKENVSFPWEYFVFLQNYDYPLIFFSISWSLCVEEQFYLLIAPLLGLLSLAGKKTTTTSLFLLLILPFFFRSLGWYEHPNETHVRLDGCVMGVFLAHIHHQYPKVWSLIAKYSIQILIVSISIYLLFFVGRYYPQLGINDPGKLFLAFIFGTFVIAANKNNHWRSKLFLPGSYYIATRSYALYLLHPEILALLRRFLPDIPFLLYLSLTLAGSIIISEFLYRAVERPIMNYRENLTITKDATT